MNRLRKIMYLGPIRYVMGASVRGKWPHRQHLLSSERANRYNESVTHVAKIVIRFYCFCPPPQHSSLECVVESIDA